ncbi:hypothetical protein SPFL3102_02883 [Sporomusaceae bacterium FL31]|nr:hypothetical protein SPFL3101_01213 [Sporomusaceae bacterium FL31]GCE35055.1 hypothetical protein SPFL3102_02883 [Sporomusaceae bacterium]
MLKSGYKKSIVNDSFINNAFLFILYKHGNHDPTMKSFIPHLGKKVIIYILISKYRFERMPALSLCRELRLIAVHRRTKDLLIKKLPKT